MALNRPWIALAKSAGPPAIQIRSLKNDQQMIKVLTLPGVGGQSEPIWIESNSSVLVVATHTFIVGYDLLKFNEKFLLTNPYSSLPLALSTRWFAFADYRLYTIHQSAGTINASLSEQNASYTGVVLNAAKSISKSVAKISESVLGYSGQPPNATEKNSPPQQALLANMSMNNGTGQRHRHGSGKDETQAGIVTIIDTVKFFGVRRSEKASSRHSIGSSRHLFMMNDRIGSSLIFKLIPIRLDICNSIQVDIYSSHVIPVDIISMS